MKKILATLSIILIAVFCLLTLLDRKGDYNAEKKIWRLNQRYAQITKDPKTFPDAQLDKLAHDYKKFTQRFPDSTLAPVSLIHAGRVFMIKRDYAKALSLLDQTLEQFPDNEQTTLIVLAEKLKIYMEQKDSTNVVASYQRIQQEFPYSLMGLQAPLSIVKHHINLNQKVQATAALKAAFGYYDQLLKTEDDRDIRFHVLNLLSQAYALNNQWHDSALLLSEILMTFPDSKYLNLERANALLKNINKISVLRLNDLDSPITVYKKFIATYEKHPLNPILLKMIETLETLKKEKSLKSSTP